MKNVLIWATSGALAVFAGREVWFLASVAVVVVCAVHADFARWRAHPRKRRTPGGLTYYSGRGPNVVSLSRRRKRTGAPV